METRKQHHGHGGSVRRNFLKKAGLAAMAALAAALARRAAFASRAFQSAGAPEKKGLTFRPDLLDKNSPKGIEVIQLTTEKAVPSSHIYMEAQIFTPDAKRLVLHRSAHAHGSDKNDPEHRYLVFDLENDCRLMPITEEVGVTAPSVSPDGKYLYYFVDETEVNGGRLTLKRVCLDGRERQTIVTLDQPLPGTRFRPSQIYPLSTVSSDGKRLALSAFLGDGQAKGAPWGLLVFDVDKATVNLIIHGPTWCNMHPQYCRSLDPETRRDLLIQENHGNACDAQGHITTLVGGDGADIHVIRDDGANFRTMPWGRDGNEFCQGHQCWRGRSDWAITSTSTRQPPEAQLIESRAVADAGHLGSKTAGGVRNHLSREFPKPAFYHFATDMAGRRLISDAGPLKQGGRLWVAELGEPGKDPLGNFRFLLGPRCSGAKGAHIHPFLSPDGSLAFFNSDESGLLQAYMVRGL
ncbi:MAG: PD40 domain-containing protein [Planctomycetes bacterium]|nr:PD40 domain-containing protein [Planctomycetota bacterium]